MGLWLNHLQHKKYAETHAAIHEKTKGNPPTYPQTKMQKLAERETELIQLTHQLVDQIGFANLTMDKLVSASVYSKGTIYNHFGSKEDLLAALGGYSISFILELMEKASSYPGLARERALALNFAYQLYTQLEPALSLCVLSCKTPTVIDKASAKQMQNLKTKEMQIFEYIDQVFNDGIADGSLPVKSGLSQQQQIALYSFSGWALSFGATTLASQSGETLGVTRLKQNNLLLQSVNLLLDGMNWQPLSSQFDYQQSWGNIIDFFSDYTAMLNGTEQSQRTEEKQ